MTAGLIQLISKGVIDSFLTDMPEITFFKSVFHRYTNFAIELYESVFNGSTNFDSMNDCIINQYGDLVSDIILKIELPALNDKVVLNKTCVKGICDCYCDKCNKSHKQTIYSWANSIGHVMIDYIELYIGGKLIDRHYGEWFEIWTELTQTNEKRPGYSEMIGKKEPTNFTFNSFTNKLTLYVPLNFWFCRNIGHALPLVSLFYEDVNIRIKWNSLKNCIVSNSPYTSKQVSSFNATLLIDYVFLDIIEREKFIRQPQMYAIEQLQYYEYSYSKSVKNPKVDLSSFNHPIKELIWALQRSDINSTNDGSLGNDWYNYGPNKDRLNVKNTSNDTFHSGKILLNGLERIKETKASYYRLVQPYKYHTRIPTNYLYVYSFSLKPEELQPTGSCNFSLFSNINLQLTGVQMPVDYVIKVWCTNINILLITGGMSGIAEL